MFRALVRQSLCFVLAAMTAVAHGDSLLQPWADVGDTPSAPWQVVGLPQQKKQLTQFSLVEVDGRRALRVEANNAYGNLVQTLNSAMVPQTLSWLWRVEIFNTAADLRHKQTDDTTLKVCVFFDLPLRQVPFFERQILRVARARSPVPLPAATVCYVLDPMLPAGTTLENAYTSRVRYVVLANGDALKARWRTEQRNVAQDFLNLFGDESQQLPPVIGVGIGADSDNTHARSVGYVADLVLAP